MGQASDTADGRRQVRAQQEKAGRVSLSLRVAWPFARELYGKAGVLSWRSNFEILSGADERARDLLLGVGLSFQGGRHWSLHFEYEDVDVDLESAMLGIAFHFQPGLFMNEWHLVKD